MALAGRAPYGRRLAWAAAALGPLLCSMAVRAADDTPPPFVPATADRGAAGAVEQGAAPGGATAGEPAEPQPPPAPKPQRDVQIEQKHVGRRLSEVIVTPAGFTYHYTMDNLEGQDSGSVLQPHPSLSVPRFFRFDF